MGTRTRGKLSALLAVVGALTAVAPAGASELLARDAADVRLQVNRKGFALVTYTLPGGKQGHPLVWGAVNANHPNPDVPQVEFNVDYSGGWGTFRKKVWKTFKNACRPYDGPELAFFVAGCKAPDGSYWALQAWDRTRPIFGRRPQSAIERAVELRISHWTGDLAVLDVHQDWKYSVRLHNLFGRYLYQGVPVHGFKATRTGNPQDGYGRNIYMESLGSAYGEGWARTNGLLTHNPTGVFCEAFGGSDFLPDQPLVNHGKGARYRLIAVGPGVTPDVVWEGAAQPEWNESDPGILAHEDEMNRLMASFGDDDPRCTEL
jgi:hypothetical protein